MYSEVFQVIFAREAGWERPVLLRNVEATGRQRQRENQKERHGSPPVSVPQTQALTAPGGERFQSHRIGDPAPAGDYATMPHTPPHPPLLRPHPPPPPPHN